MRTGLGCWLSDRGEAVGAHALAELAARAEFPNGVINVVTGEASTVAAELMANSLVRKVTFTGSTRVGKLLIAQSAKSVKKLSLELGGNAPLIVFDDADIDVALRGTIASKFRNSGQTCVCANRVFVQDGIFDEFARRLAEAVDQLTVGDGLDPKVQQGPLINRAAVERVARAVSDAVAKGARILTAGAKGAAESPFYPPTVLVDAPTDSILAVEEIFGPVAALFRFSTEADVVQYANDTRYGLAAYIFTRDLDRMWRVSEKLECGIVGVNEGRISNEVAPFGGVKESGFGREGSKYGIDEFLSLKYLMVAHSS